LQTIEDEKALQLPPPQPHRDIDRATVRIDKTYALRHYLNSAASVLSEVTVRPAPSMQISSYLGSESFGEAQTFITAPTALASMNCSQIFIAGLPNKKTVILQVTPLDTVKLVEYKIRKKLGLPDASFQFIYRNRVLQRPNATLENYGVLHDSTLICASFRLDRTRPGVWSQSVISSVTIKFPTRSVDLEFDDTEQRIIRDVKLKLQAVEGTKPSEVLFHNFGILLKDDSPLTPTNLDVYKGHCTITALLRPRTHSGHSVRDDNRLYVPTLRQGSTPKPSALGMGWRRMQRFPRPMGLETVEEVSTAGASDRTSVDSSEDYITKDNTFKEGRGSVRRNLFSLRLFRKMRE
jgi:hypothetical protein